MNAFRSLFVVALLLVSVQSTSAKNIIWVSEGRTPALAAAYSAGTAQGWTLEDPFSTTPFDQGFVDLLTNAGHTIDYRTNASTGNATTDWLSNGYWQEDLTQQQKDDLNAADLVIISPDLNGANYGDPVSTDRRNAWNTLSVPMLSLTPQTLTNDVFGWMGVSIANHIKEANISQGIPSVVPRYMRSVWGGPVPPDNGYFIADSNDTVQFDFLDHEAGSGKLTYVNQNFGELITWTDPHPEAVSRTFATTGEHTFNNNAWIAPSGKSYIQWHTRWQTGQDWYCNGSAASCNPPPPTQANPGGPRQMFMASSAAGAKTGGFFYGAGVENLTPAGEMRLTDIVREMTAASPEDLRINREIPKYTATVDGAVSQDELDSQLEISMVFPYSGGSIIESTFVENVSQGFSEDRFSARWYASWDDTNLYITAAVKDDAPVYNQVVGSTFYNQDSVLINFNPNDDPAGLSKRAYYAAVQTGDSAGPQVERSGGVALPAVALVGVQTVGGYTLEMAIPWSEAMIGAGGASYVPTPGDQHGFGLQLRGKNFNSQSPNAQAAITDHWLDYGNWEGNQFANFVFDQLRWNYLTLVGDASLTADLDFDGDVDGNDFLIGQRQALPGNFLADWQAQYGTVPLSADASTVPEPTTVGLVLMASIPLLGRCKRGASPDFSPVSATSP